MKTTREVFEKYIREQCVNGPWVKYGPHVIRSALKNTACTSYEKFIQCCEYHQRAKTKLDYNYRKDISLP